MAKRAITIYVDDLDGTESESGETVLFGVQGRFYEIDLCEANRAKFEKALAPFIAKSRPRSVGRFSTASMPTRGGLRAGREEERRGERGLIRSWFNALAEAERASIYRKGGGGLAPERGRIAEDIVDAYRNRQVVSAAAPAEVKATPGIPALSARGAMTETMERASKAAAEPAPAPAAATEPKTAPRKPRKPKAAVPPVAQFQAAGGQAGRSA